MPSGAGPEALVEVLVDLLLEHAPEGREEETQADDHGDLFDFHLEFAVDPGPPETQAFVVRPLVGQAMLLAQATRHLFGSGAGLMDSLEVVQGDARLRGVELSAAVRAREWLTLQLAGDVVHGTNVTSGIPLTFVPPPRLLGGVRLERRGIGGAVVRPWVSVEAERNWRQDRLDPRDLGPPGYTLWHAGAGGTLLAGSRVVIVDVAVRNALDARYRNFMSRYKAFADGPGRAVVLRLTTEWP